MATVLAAPPGYEPGVHINAVAGTAPANQPDPASGAARQCLVEFGPQTRIEGEIQTLEPPDFPVTELWEVLERSASQRHAPRPTVAVFDSVGCAVEDLSALRYVCAAPCEGRRSGEKSTSSPSRETQVTSSG